MSLWRAPSWEEVKSVLPLCSVDLKTWGLLAWAMEDGVKAEEMGQWKVRRLEEMNNPWLWPCFPGQTEAKITSYIKKEGEKLKRLKYYNFALSIDIILLRELWHPRERLNCLAPIMCLHQTSKESKCNKYLTCLASVPDISWYQSKGDNWEDGLCSLKSF